jgi:hypothetical protein
MIGPPLPRLLASLLMGFVLVVSYWWGMENIPAAMLAEAAASYRDGQPRNWQSSVVGFGWRTLTQGGGD